MDAITSGVSGLLNKAKGTIASVTGQAVDPLKKPDSPIAPLVTQGGAKMIGMGAEPKGYTSAGGKRLKTRSVSKKRKSSSRKTRSASKRKH